MSDKARELLGRALHLLADEHWVQSIKDLDDCCDAIRAYLAEENKSDPDSVALQSRCRGDKEVVVPRKLKVSKEDMDRINESCEEWRQKGVPEHEIEKYRIGLIKINGVEV